MAVNYLYPGHIEHFKDFVNSFAKDWDIQYEEHRDNTVSLIFAIKDSPFMGYITINEKTAQVGVRIDWPMPEIGLEAIKFDDEPEASAIIHKLAETLGENWKLTDETLSKDFGKLDANREDWYKACVAISNNITKMEHKLHPPEDV